MRENHQHIHHMTKDEAEAQKREAAHLVKKMNREKKERERNILRGYSNSSRENLSRDNSKKKKERLKSEDREKSKRRESKSDLGWKK